MNDDDVFDFVDSIERYSSVDDLLDDFQKRAAVFGLEHVIVTGLAIGRQDMMPLVLLNGWPQEWLERYAANYYADIDPVGLHAAQTLSAFDWSEVPENMKKHPDRQKVMNEATEFDLNSGIVVPCFSQSQWMTVVSMGSGERELNLSRRDRMRLAYMSAAVAGAAERMQGLVGMPLELTLREREILTHTAVGATASQLAERLMISPATVISHLNNIRQKFGVKTTVQAVVEAIRRGYILP